MRGRISAHHHPSPLSREPGKAKSDEPRDAASTSPHGQITSERSWGSDKSSLKDALEYIPPRLTGKRDLRIYEALQSTISDRILSFCTCRDQIERVRAALHRVDPASVVAICEWVISKGSQRRLADCASPYSLGLSLLCIHFSHLESSEDARFAFQCTLEIFFDHFCAKTALERECAALLFLRLTDATLPFTIFDAQQFMAGRGGSITLDKNAIATVDAHDSAGFRASSAKQR